MGGFGAIAGLNHGKIRKALVQLLQLTLQLALQLISKNGDRSSSFLELVWGWSDLLPSSFRPQKPLIEGTFAIEQTSNPFHPHQKAQTETSAINFILKYRLLCHDSIVAPPDTHSYLSCGNQSNLFWVDCGQQAAC